MLRSLLAEDEHGHQLHWPVDDDGTCRAGYTCKFVGDRAVAHILHLVGPKAEPRIGKVYCPENLPEGATKLQLRPGSSKIFVTLGEGYLPPIAWNEPDWQKYLPRPTKPINAYIEPYYTDPRWWDDSGETPHGMLAVELVAAWKEFKAGRPVAPHFAATFERFGL